MYHEYAKIIDNDPKKLQVLLSKLPAQFDWQYYLVANPDLLQANIETETQAALHYLDHGRNEARIYCQASSDVISETILNNQFWLSEDIKYIKEIVLFTHWYNAKDSETSQNNIRCLEHNLKNKFIKYVCLLVEHQTTIIPTHLINHPKLRIKYINKRLTYYDWIEYSVNNYSPYIKILANTDIYFDDTLEYVLTRHFTPKTFYSITRKDIDDDGNIGQSYDSYQDYTRPTNPNYSQDCWIFQQLSVPLDPNKINFELGIGNCDRLFKDYLETQCGINLINLYQSINAIHLDKRKNRSRNSYALTNDMIDYEKFNIKLFISDLCLKPYTNKLESITLLLTGAEIKNNTFDKFLQRLGDSIDCRDKKYCELLTFNIATQYTIDQQYISTLKQYFRNVNIIPLNIPKEYDAYQLNTPCPYYGKTAGPNWCFFETISKLHKYNTTLLLECDVFFQTGWLTQIYNYCLYSGHFWISGSKNYGYNQANIHHVGNEHINGGVCLYATGNQNLQAWIAFCKQMLPIYIKHKMPDMPYDYLLYFVMHDFFNNDRKNYSIWHFIRQNYICNKLIYNLSSIYEIDTKAEEFKKLCPFSILHKKGDA